LKTRAEVSAEKLRGGFYTPPALVARCLDVAAGLLGGRSGLRVLEPSAGDGAFLRGLAGHPLGGRVAAVTAIEPDASEAAAARAALAWPGEVRVESALAWPGEVGGGRPRAWPGDARVGSGPAGTAPAGYDLAVGNPPFVRYQFIGPADRQAALALGERLGEPLGGVANLWIPVLLAALDQLAPGGAFAFVVPAELFTGVSAGSARRWLLAWTDELSAELVPPGAFAGALQEVVVLAGRRRATPRLGPAALAMREPGAAPWTWPADPAAPTWMPALLSADAAGAWAEALALPAVRRLGDVARFEVAIVTGANGFFSVDDAQVAAHGLGAWARPLLPRIRHAPGLRFDAAEHAALAAGGGPARLLHFAAGEPDPRAFAGPAAYLAAGEAAGLPARHKCGIREPWFRVPHVRAGRFMLSKRCHLHPRVVLNEAGVLTTDTIYRGALRAAGDEGAFVASFHNGLTMLAAELGGRSFGGGVLELVPSEIARLPVVLAPGAGGWLDGLDALARAGGDLVAATDARLAQAGVGLDAALLDRLRAGATAMRGRRLARG